MKRDSANMWRMCCALDVRDALESYLVYITKSLLEQPDYIESGSCNAFKSGCGLNPEQDNFHHATNLTSGSQNLMPKNSMSSNKVCVMSNQTSPYTRSDVYVC